MVDNCQQRSARDRAERVPGISRRRNQGRPGCPGVLLGISSALRVDTSAR